MTAVSHNVAQCCAARLGMAWGAKLSTTTTGGPPTGGQGIATVLCRLGCHEMGVVGAWGEEGRWTDSRPLHSPKGATRAQKIARSHQ